MVDGGQWCAQFSVQEGVYHSLERYPEVQRQEEGKPSRSSRRSEGNFFEIK